MVQGHIVEHFVLLYIIPSTLNKSKTVNEEQKGVLWIGIEMFLKYQMRSSVHLVLYRNRIPLGV